MDLLNCNWDHARFLIFSGNVYDPLIYYSHLVPLVTSLVIGIYVFFTNRKALANKILLFLSLTFSTWVFFDLILWASEKIEYIIFFWSILTFFDLLVYVLTFYLVYVYLFGKDLALKFKILISLFFIPLFIFTQTKYNLEAFDFTNCDRGAIEGLLWKYIYITEVLFIILILAVFIWKYFNTDKEKRRPILIFSLGSLILLLTFTIGNFTLFFEMDWKWEQYKLFGMPIFVGLLSYMIVKYRAFNVKLIAAQALVAALIILIGSQFAFIQNPTNKILNGITLALSIIGGYVLVRSVKLEVERKEQLQIMTNKLSQANDKLRVLDNAKSEFISIASHQLRTPLTAVKGYASLLLEGSYGKVDEKQKDVLNKMYQSNERLITLVEDMLNLSRIESGRMEYKFEDIEIEGVLQEIYDTFVLRAKERNLSLELVKSEKPLPKIKTDRNKIREIISNFTDNAIKYTPAGGVKLKAFEKGGKVVVAVSDTGIGIPKGELPYLFEKFSRGKDTSRLNAGGTGLGLHVGIKMIEELKGRIWVESEGAGKGSTFFVELPVG